jgi:hypothetical protein
MSDERELIDFDAAVALLPDRETVHTFRGGGMMLIGADWPRDRLLAAMREAKEIQVTGPQAQRMGYGLAIDHEGWLFIETRRQDAA